MSKGLETTGAGFVAPLYLPLSATPPVLRGHVKSFLILLTTVGMVCPLSVIRRLSSMIVRSSSVIGHVRCEADKVDYISAITSPNDR